MNYYKIHKYCMLLLFFFFQGGILSSAKNMAAWMNMLLLDGQNDAGQEVVSRAAIYETRKPVNAFSYSQNPLVLPPRYPIYMYA